jgi:glucosyl-dolichyl phosphate glucuronosyltransferase
MIYHFVSDKRCRFAYFLSRCYAEGISKAQVTANVGSSDGLSNERAYATRTLPLGVIRGVADVFRGRPSGLGRAGAIIAGLGMTAAGYASTKLSAAIAKPDQGPQLQTT